MARHKLRIVNVDLTYSFLLISTIWLFVFLLFLLNLTDLFENISKAFAFQLCLSFSVAIILGNFAIRLILNKRWYSFGKKIYYFCVDIDSLTKKANKITLLFFAIVFLEIIVEGYIPLFTMIKGVKISQFEFGIKSLHGFVLSLGTLLFTLWYFLYCVEKNTRAIYYMLCIILVFSVLVTRKMIIVAFVQAFFVAFFLRKDQKIFLKTFIFGTFVIFLFGWIGDVRTGRDLFLDLSQFSHEYPGWLPTGFGWIYIYITTPLANFINAVNLSPDPSFSLDFISTLFPSLVRDVFFAIDSDPFSHFWQISGAFNVGTGLMVIYLSFGLVGVYLFLFFAVGFLYGILSYKINSLCGFLVFVVFYQCALFLIFNNNFFNLNTISQAIFIIIFFGTIHPTKADVT